MGGLCFGILCCKGYLAKQIACHEVSRRKETKTVALNLRRKLNPLPALHPLYKQLLKYAPIIERGALRESKMQ
jgi:hypothetical protein